MSGRKEKEKMLNAVHLVLVVSLCAAVFFLALLVITNYFRDRYGSYKAPAITGTPYVPVSDAPSVACELVLVVDAGGSLSNVLLIETDCINVRLRVSTIPLDTRLELSVALYRECVKANVSTPQFTTVSELYKYFEGDTAADLTFKAVRELLPFEPDFMTVMKRETFLLVFEDPAGKNSPSEFAVTLPDNIKRAGSLYEFVKQLQNGCKGNKPLEAALFYLESYENLTNRTATVRLIPGQRHTNGYTVSAGSDDYYRK